LEISQRPLPQSPDTIVPIEQDESATKVTPAHQKRQIYQPFISSFLGDPEILSERIPTNTKVVLNEDPSPDSDFR